MTEPARMRLARMSDVDAMTSIFGEASARGGLMIPPEVAMTESDNIRRGLQQVIGAQSSTHRVVVAVDDAVAKEDDGGLLGYVEYFQENSREIVVNQLYAKKNKARAGRRMLGHVALFALSNGVDMLRVYPLQDARGYYRELGFEDDPACGINEQHSMILRLKQAQQLVA